MVDIDILDANERNKRLAFLEKRFPIFINEVIKKFQPESVVVMERGGSSIFFNCLDLGQISFTNELTAVDVNRNCNYICLNKELIQGKRVLIFDDMIDSGGTMLKAVKSIKKFASQVIIAPFCVSKAIKDQVKNETFRGIPIKYDISLSNDQEMMEFQNVLSHFFLGMFFPTDIIATYVSGRITPNLQLDRLKEFKVKLNAKRVIIKQKEIEKFYLATVDGNNDVELKLYIRKSSEVRAFGYIGEGSKDFCNSCKDCDFCRIGNEYSSKILHCPTIENGKIRELITETISKLTGANYLFVPSVDHSLERMIGCFKNRHVFKI